VGALLCAFGGGDVGTADLVLAVSHWRSSHGSSCLPSSLPVELGLGTVVSVTVVFLSTKLQCCVVEGGRWLSVSCPCGRRRWLRAELLVVGDSRDLFASVVGCEESHVVVYAQMERGLVG
jgi:hypothetical protein